MATHTTTAWLFLLLAAQCHAQDRTMKLQRVEYLVGELPEYPQQLTITRDAVRYESHSNASQQGVGIGVFERPVAKGEIDTIESQLDAAALGPLPDHRGQVLSGDRSRRIRLTGDDGTIEKLVGTKLPINPALQRAIDWLDKMVEDVTKHPRQVLQLSLQDAVLGRNGELTGTVVLIGIGDQPVRFRAAQARSNVADDLLTLYWWPSGGPKDNVQAAALASRGAAAKPPGALAAFEIRSRLEGISGGGVAVQVRYLNMTPKVDGLDVLVGELFSRPVVVVP